MWPLISDEVGKGWKMLYIMGGKTLNLEMWPLISDEDGKGWKMLYINGWQNTKLKCDP